MKKIILFFILSLFSVFLVNAENYTLGTKDSFGYRNITYDGVDYYVLAKKNFCQNLFTDYFPEETKCNKTVYVRYYQKEIQDTIASQTATPLDDAEFDTVTANNYYDFTDAWQIKDNETNQQLVLAIDDRDGKIDHSTYPQQLIVEDKRDVGTTMTWIIELIKNIFQLDRAQNDRLEKLKNQNEIMRDELCRKDNTYSFCPR